MPIVAAPAYDNSWMAPIAQNFMTLINGDPEAKAKAAYYGSEIQKNRADAARLGAEGARTTAANAIMGDMQNTVHNMRPPDPGEDPVAAQTRMDSARARFLQAYPGINPEEAQHALTGNIATAFMQMPDENSKRTGSLLGGHPMAATDAATTGQIAADQAAEAAKAANVANIGAGAEVAKAHIMAGAQISDAKIREAAANARDKGKPVVIGEGGMAVWPDGHVTYGQPTKNTVEAGAGGWLMQHPDQIGTSPITNLFYGSAGASGAGKNTVVNGKTMNDVMALAFPGDNNFVDPSNPKNIQFTPEYLKTVDPAILASAQEHASQVFQTTKNAQTAAQTLRDDLGLTPGASFSTPWFWQNQGHLNQGGAPATAPATGAPSASAPSAPSGGLPQGALKVAYNKDGVPSYLTQDASGKKSWVTPSASAPSAPSAIPVTAQPFAPANTNEAQGAQPTVMGISMPGMVQGAVPASAPSAPPPSQVPAFNDTKTAYANINSPDPAVRAAAYNFLNPSPVVAPFAPPTRPLTGPTSGQMRLTEAMRQQSDPNLNSQQRAAAKAYVDGYYSQGSVQ